MRAWIAAAVILAAVQFVTGCATVSLGEPVGAVAPLSKKLKWQGIWLGDQGLAYVVFVDDADKGALQICGLGTAKGNRRPPLVSYCFGAQVRLVGDAQVLHVAADEFLADREPEFRESLKGRWFIVLLEHKGERVISWLFEGNEAEKLIEAGKLAGKVNRKEGNREVRIDRLEPDLLKRWISEDAGEFTWRKPGIFDYHPLLLP